jgi:hypothetical protein
VLKRHAYISYKCTGLNLRLFKNAQVKFWRGECTRLADRLHGVITLNVVTSHILRNGTRRFILVFPEVSHLT